MLHRVQARQGSAHVGGAAQQFDALVPKLAGCVVAHLPGTTKMSAEVAGHTSDTVATQSTAQPRQQHDLSRIGKYQVLPAKLGDGGFCSLYKCKYPSANSGTVTVAVKLSTCPVSIHDNAQVNSRPQLMTASMLQLLCQAELASHPLQWESHRREWQTYQNLSFGRTAESHSAGIPAVYECACLKVPQQCKILALQVESLSTLPAFRHHLNLQVVL